MSDPNWFYSTIAQSSAAIVGLLGAILMTKLIDRSNGIQEEKQIIQNNIRAAVGALLSSMNVGNIPQDVSPTDRAILLELDKLWRGENVGKDFEKNSEIHDQKRALINDVRFRSPTNLANYSLPSYLTVYKAYNGKLLPWSYYVIYIILILITIVGLFIPIYHLSGFDKNVAKYFIIAVSLIYFWLAWQLFDFWNSNRIKIKKL